MRSKWADDADFLFQSGAIVNEVGMPSCAMDTLSTAPVQGAIMNEMGMLSCALDKPPTTSCGFSFLLMCHRERGGMRSKRADAAVPCRPADQQRLQLCDRAPVPGGPLGHGGGYDHIGNRHVVSSFSLSGDRGGACEGL